jgi:hypothetical protein
VSAPPGRKTRPSHRRRRRRPQPRAAAAPAAAACARNSPALVARPPVLSTTALLLPRNSRACAVAPACAWASPWSAHGHWSARHGAACGSSPLTGSHSSALPSEWRVAQARTHASTGPTRQPAPAVAAAMRAADRRMACGARRVAVPAEGALLASRGCPRPPPCPMPAPQDAEPAGPQGGRGGQGQQPAGGQVRVAAGAGSAHLPARPPRMPASGPPCGPPLLRLGLTFRRAKRARPLSAACDLGEATGSALTPCLARPPLGSRPPRNQANQGLTPEHIQELKRQGKVRAAVHLTRQQPAAAAPGHSPAVAGRAPHRPRKAPRGGKQQQQHANATPRVPRPPHRPSTLRPGGHGYRSSALQQQRNL